MLILTRRKDELVMIGHHIKVRVLDIRGNQVRLGFEAPPEVSIHRDEIYCRIQVEKEKENTDVS